MKNVTVVDVPFKRLAVDLTRPTEPASEAGHRYILTLVDYAKKYPEAVPFKRFDSKTVAEALVYIISRLGVQKKSLVIREQSFISHCMREEFRPLGVTRSTIIPYHPIVQWHNLADVEEAVQ